jgi:hypothetical protein
MNIILFFVQMITRYVSDMRIMLFATAAVLLCMTATDASPLQVSPPPLPPLDLLTVQ